MPSIFDFYGYKIYFWSNENNEPIHVHICRGKPTSNATKIWLTSDGGALICHNKSRIGKKDLAILLDFIHENCYKVQSEWVQYFGYITYYC